MGEDLGLQALEVRARVQAEVLDERVAGAAVGLQRVGLAAGAVQGEHQLRVEALAVRVLVGEALELGDQLGAAAELEVQVDAALEDLEAGALEPVRLARGRPVDGRVGERRAAEERERLAQQLARLLGRSGAGLDGERLEALEVQRAAADRVAGRARLDRVRAEQPAQLGDVDLQRLGGGGGRVLVPQDVDQAGGRHAAVPAPQQQGGEQRPVLGRAELDLAVRPHDPQRTEDREVHRRGTLPRLWRGLAGPRDASQHEEHHGYGGLEDGIQVLMGGYRNDVAGWRWGWKYGLEI